MPAKKNNSKRGKTAAKAKTILEAEDATDLKEQKVTGNDNLDATFLVTENKDFPKVVGNGLSKIENGDEADEQSVSGNGDAPDLFDKIVEEDDDEVEEISSKKIKGRPKTVSKKNESPQLESIVDDREDEDVGSSPKRPLDGVYEEENAKEPPAKRNRGKKVPVPKKAPKAKDESESVANDDDSEVVKSSPKKASERAIEEEPLTKRNQKAGAVKKGRKGKEEVEHEKDEEKLTKKKGRPAKELPEKDDVEGVAASSKTTQKRTAAKEKAVPEPSTRPIRTRKPVTYGEAENGNEEFEDVTTKKSKKAVPKKGMAKKTDEKTTKAPAGGARKRGRAVEEKPQKEVETSEE